MIAVALIVAFCGGTVFGLLWARRWWQLDQPKPVTLRAIEGGHQAGAVRLLHPPYDWDAS